MLNWMAFQHNIKSNFDLVGLGMDTQLEIVTISTSCQIDFNIASEAKNPIKSRSYSM